MGAFDQFKDNASELADRAKDAVGGDRSAEAEAARLAEERAEEEKKNSDS
ncbi:hypothetical protein [Streptomyces sp. C3-3]|nr:hypothetical protein [Streptomyces sp. C3-3]MBQ1116233.1 hypothetical protein [Streptomyces sp. C3-3]